MALRIFLVAAAAIAAHAHAETDPPFVLYGVVDVALERVTSSPGGRTLRLSNGVQSANRWGVKGSDDLGGGIVALFQLESGFNAADGGFDPGSHAFGRQAWVGFRAPAGTLKLGRQYTPLIRAVDAVDPFATGLTGDGSGIAGVFRVGGVRMDSTVTYAAPTVAGLSLNAAYSWGGAGNHAGRQWGWSLSYDAAPWTLVAAGHVSRDAVPWTDARASRTAFAGAVYDGKALKLHAALASNRDVVAQGAVRHSSDWMAGVTVPAGAWSFLAATVGHAADEAGGHARYHLMGATLRLSPRTSLYASHSTLRNGDAANFCVPAAGMAASWLNLGITHSF